MNSVIETSHVYTFLNDTYFKDKSKKLFALEGSSGAAKTWGGIDFILQYCRINSYENKRITIGRETYKDCIETVAYDFFKRLKQINWYNTKYHSQSHPQKYFLFGNEIDFTGWSNNGQPSKRQDGLWFNEILESYEEIFKNYNQRTNDFVLFDWNPRVTMHWVYNVLLNRPDCFYKKCLLLDNPFLPEGQRNELLAYEPTPENIKNGTADDFMYKVYVLGERADAKGLIFKLVTWIDSFPESIRTQWGLDFGYTNDPTCLTKVGVSPGNVFAEIKCYEPIDNAYAISEMLKNTGVKRHEVITADSSDRYDDYEMVKDLRELGWHIVKVNKGKGVKWRIGLLKKNKINIVHNVNAKREQENYKWREINGILINEPIDKFNHFWDSLGYGYLGMMDSNVGIVW
jgi:phage terminase large subunit